MSRLLAVLFLLAGCALWLVDRRTLHGEQAARDLLQRKVTLLEGENERLRGLVGQAEAGKALTKSEVWRRRIEADVEEIRGLKFKKPVVYAAVSRQEIKGVVAKKLEQQYTEQDFVTMSAALSRLGLLPAGYPLRQKFIDLLGEQIAAFYDQHEHKLFMFQDASLENTQNQVVLAHELTHALQDQYYNLLKLPLEIKDDDDRAIAASALVEGDATLVMSAYMMRHLSLQTLKENVGSALTQSTQKLAEAPRYLRESLLFPYLRGQEFCQTMTADLGFVALNRCYKDLPASTAEILHPSRYPQHLELPALPAKWSVGEEPALSNVLGEAALRIHLADALDDVAANKLAAQSRGDRYAYFENPEALAWTTVWENADAASQFAIAERKVLEKRYGPLSWSEDSTGSQADGERHLRLKFLTPERALLIDASTRTLADGLLQGFTQ